MPPFDRRSITFAGRRSPNACRAIARSRPPSIHIQVGIRKQVSITGWLSNGKSDGATACLA